MLDNQWLSFGVEGIIIAMISFLYGMLYILFHGDNAIIIIGSFIMILIGFAMVRTAIYKHERLVSER